MHCGIDCSRSGTHMPDLDPFQIWKFARTVYRVEAFGLSLKIILLE